MSITTQQATGLPRWTVLSPCLMSAQETYLSHDLSLEEIRLEIIHITGFCIIGTLILGVMKRPIQAAATGTEVPRQKPEQLQSITPKSNK